MKRPLRSLDDVAREVRERALPALFADASAALDIIRCVRRDRADARVAAVVRQVVDARAAGELLLYGPSVLAEEAERNRVGVESEARRYAGEVDAAVAAYQAVAAAVGHPYSDAAEVDHERLIAPLVALHDQLLDACDHLAKDRDAQVAALERAGLRRRPARGGGGANDCLMFEEFRRVALAAQSAGPIVLVTTNTADFADVPAKTRMHPDIAADLEGTNAVVCLTWPQAAAAVLDRRWLLAARD